MRQGGGVHANVALCRHNIAGVLRMSRIISRQMLVPNHCKNEFHALETFENHLT